MLKVRVTKHILSSRTCVANPSTPGEARIQQLQKRIDLACLSIAGHGTLQINQMISVVRNMTMREFCGKYGADVNKWLADYVQQQTREARSYETIRRSQQARSRNR